MTDKFDLPEAKDGRRPSAVECEKDLFSSLRVNMQTILARLSALEFLASPTAGEAGGEEIHRLAKEASDLFNRADCSWKGGNPGRLVALDTMAACSSIMDLYVYTMETKEAEELSEEYAAARRGEAAIIKSLKLGTDSLSNAAAQVLTWFIADATHRR